MNSEKRRRNWSLKRVGSRCVGITNRTNLNKSKIPKIMRKKNRAQGESLIKYIIHYGHDLTEHGIFFLIIIRWLSVRLFFGENALNITQYTYEGRLDSSSRLSLFKSKAFFFFFFFMSTMQNADKTKLLWNQLPTFQVRFVLMPQNWHKKNYCSPFKPQRDFPLLICCCCFSQ